MDNLKLPAYPQQTYEEIGMQGGVPGIATYTDSRETGFTKLELASLMIASKYIGEAGDNPEVSDDWLKKFSQSCATIAKSILEEANK